MFFTNMFLWRNYFHTYWTIDHDFADKPPKHGKDFFLQPLAAGAHLPLVIEELRTYLDNKGFEFHRIYENSLEDAPRLRLQPTMKKTGTTGTMSICRQTWLICRTKISRAENHYNAFES